MQALFQNLVKNDVTQVSPLEFEAITITELREQLKLFGFNLDSLTKSQIESLQEEQFRGLDSGRGPGFVALMHKDQDVAILKAKAISDATLVLAKELKCRRIVSNTTHQPIDGSENRSLMQALADLLSIAALSTESGHEEFIRRLNRRIWRGLLILCKTEEEKEAVNRNFAQYGDIPTARTASLPPNALMYLWPILLLVAFAYS